MKLKRLIVSGFAVCGLLTGCLSEPEFEPVLDDYGKPLEVHLFNEIQQVPVTRVNDEGFCDGDEVGVYVVNYVDGNPGTLAVEDNQADNVRYTLEELSGVWKPESPVYYLDKTTKVDIYGYYPYAEPTEVEAWPFEIAKDQSRDAENGHLGGYEASDFLWARAAGISPTSSKVVLQFHHMMAGVRVTVAEGEGFAEGEFATLDKAVLVTNTKRQTTINFGTGEVTAVGDVPTTGTIPYKKGDEFRAIVAPQTVAANTPLFSLTVDGLPYVFTKSEGFEYSAGKLHDFTIKVDKKADGSVEFEVLSESIKAWESENITHDGEAREYVVVNCAEAGKLQEAIAAAGLDYTKVKNLKITGKVNANDFYFIRDNMAMLQSLNMKEVTIEAYTIGSENKIPDEAFRGMSSVTRFMFPENIIEIGSQAFQNTNLSGSLILPNGVKKIGYYAFEGCKFSGTLTLPIDLEEIGSSAFRDQSFVGELVIPDKVRVIGSEAFSSCYSFSGNLILPKSLEELEHSAFYGCGFTGSLEIPIKIRQISLNCFAECRGLNGKLTIPENVITIEKGAFNGCSFTQELVLPSSVLSIGEGAFMYCKFTKLLLPESLTYLGQDSFAYNSRLSGIIEIPKDIRSLGIGAFNGCSSIEGVVLNENVETISSNAFRNCYQINSIVCHAQTPPTVAAGAFNGVAKDNFTVEVPEAALNNYQTAPGWNEFKRISAHRDFSISRSKFRTLNASDSKTLTLRAPAGASWKVENCPDWVIVSPSEGVGKQDVIVTVKEMAPSAAETVTYEQMNSSGNYENVSFTGRRGEVVFLLNDKDYRSNMTVEQYNYAPEGTVIGDGYVIKNYTANKGQKGVNLVFMGDCFDAKDISEGKYLEAVNEAIGHFFALAPYKQYKDYFNVYTVVGLSPDSGIGTVNTIREARFGSQYGLQGSGSIAPDAVTCFEYACKAETVTEDNINQTLIVLVENSTEYDGITYMYGDGSAIALCPMSDDVYPYDFRGIVQHEAGGHGFGKLADEYIYHNAFIQTCGCVCCEHVDEFNAMKARGWYENLSLSGNMYDVPWSHFIFDPQYSNVVDIYEGGFFHTRGVFRSEPNSCMNNNVPYYSAISREAIVKRIMEYAGEEYSFESFKENDVMNAESQADTKAAGMGMPLPARRQHGPVFMGERPEFRK